MARHIITTNQGIADRIQPILAARQMRYYRAADTLYADNAAARDAANGMLANLDAGADLACTASYTRNGNEWSVAVPVWAEPAKGRTVIAETRTGRRTLVRLVEPVKNVHHFGTDEAQVFTFDEVTA